jgi:serine/threonine protein kinase
MMCLIYQLFPLFFSAPGGDFQTILDEDMVPFEQDVVGFLKQILEALSCIHVKNIAHLDIKVSFAIKTSLAVFMYVCTPKTLNPSYRL